MSDDGGGLRVSGVTPGPLDPPRRELRQLTGLRIIAALWVVLFHFEGQYARLLPEIGGVVWATGSRGFLAVDLFFVLSGYILAYQHLRTFSEGRGRFGRFLLKRLARIYPVHLATLVFLVLVVLVGARIGVTLGRAEHFTVEGAVQDLLLVRGWFWPSQGWNYPAWSLSAEWLAYLLFPVICLVIARVAHPRRSALVVVMLALVAVEGVGAAALPWADQDARRTPPRPHGVLLRGGTVPVHRERSRHHGEGLERSPDPRGVRRRDTVPPRGPLPRSDQPRGLRRHHRSARDGHRPGRGHPRIPAHGIRRPDIVQRVHDARHRASAVTRAVPRHRRGGGLAAPGTSRSRPRPASRRAGGRGPSLPPRGATGPACRHVLDEPAHGSARMTVRPRSGRTAAEHRALRP
ncbi:hypothetical protein ELQ90_08920 [Labedella phragmitis]|uniref:Acyltransferase 3 domain-containing protein n=1 Tax=Labedella phragmitis TaxID=2498849 RepID=A0A3S4AKZ3_9MICO|nr:hypothetical protein ELQ90_08920 [Labedella phragmitis]